jgi:hypothetical protein
MLLPEISRARAELPVLRATIMTGQTSSGSEERRAMRRFTMRLPAIVSANDTAFKDVPTETRNVSARGIFFYLDRPLDHGTRIAVTVTFPPHITMTEPLQVRFTASVVRVEAPLPVSRVGIAAAIEEYQFLPSSKESVVEQPQP